MEESIKQDIKSRTPKGWYGLASPRGWDNLVADLHIAIVEIEPDYEVYQIKEKFGGLRYYSSANSDKAIKLIKKAESKSYSICQNCGIEGDEVSLHGKYWVATSCEPCYIQQKELL